MEHSNNYYLPSFNGPNIEALETEQARELFSRYALLDALERYNMGTNTVVLSSGADGNGRSNRVTGHKLNIAAGTLVEEIQGLGFTETTVVTDAVKSDLQEVIRDETVANIFLLGHGSYHSWVATDGAIDWYDAGKMVGDHLKNGVFANLGCGAVNSWNFIPLGKFVVSTKGLLLGKSKELTSLDEMSDLSKFRVLR